MPTFLFASIPVPAHTSNPTPFAQRLIERGHTVLWYAGHAFHRQIAALGATPLPYVEADDFSGHQIEDYFPSVKGLDGPAAIRRAFADIFVGQAPQRVADLTSIVADRQVDAILSDGLMFGVELLHELGGPVWATFGDGPLPYLEPDNPPFGPGMRPWAGPVGRFRNRGVSWVARNLIFGDARRRYAQIRADLGLPVDGPDVVDRWSPYLHLQGCTPAFEYPRRNVPAEMHWVGALRPDPPQWSPPAWWAEVTDTSRPVVLVSQGSIRPDMTELVAPTVMALTGADVLVVVTTGLAEPADVEAAIGRPLPTNIRCVKFVPYDVLLPHVSAFVTNGGYTGVTLALAHGVPLVQAGKTEEKSEIAARIRWTGVGVTLGTTRPSAYSVGQGVHTVLTDPGFAAAAERVRAEMAEHDAGREGADLLEQLALTGRPVLRAETPIA